MYSTKTRGVLLIILALIVGIVIGAAIVDSMKTVEKIYIKEKPVIAEFV